MHFETTVGSECVKTDFVARINKEPGISSLPYRKAVAMRELKECNFTMLPRGYFFLLTFGIHDMLADVLAEIFLLSNGADFILTSSSWLLLLPLKVRLFDMASQPFLKIHTSPDWTARDCLHSRLQ